MQSALPFGTPPQVREQILDRCEIFARDGGFVFNTVHNLQAGTPVEDIAAVPDALNESGRGERRYFTRKSRRLRVLSTAP